MMMVVMKLAKRDRGNTVREKTGAKEEFATSLSLSVGMDSEWMGNRISANIHLGDRQGDGLK